MAGDKGPVIGFVLKMEDFPENPGMSGYTAGI
jgi:hypothetical protein